MMGTLILPVKPCSLPLHHQSRRRELSVRASVASVAQPSAAPDRRCLYEVLRVRRNASQVEIKAAYRTLAKVYHPDAAARFVDATAPAPPSSSEGGDFIEIHNAYATLSDPDARAVYDLNLNVNSQRRLSAGAGYRSPGRGRFHATRRWETDQCW